MPTIEIVCLANSRKMSGRCIAGLRTDGQGWIRPVAPGADSTLYGSDYRLADGTEPQLMDVIGIPCAAAQPAPHQPENWLIEKRRWNLVARPAPSNLNPILSAAIRPGPDLFGDRTLRRNYDNFLVTPASASLALIVPKNTRWKIVTGNRGNRQTKACFDLAGAFYELSCTDLVWNQRLDHLPLGIYAAAEIGIHPQQRLVFTVSLSEPAAWDNCCYLLIAGVILR